jgi:hypothetical protein
MSWLIYRNSIIVGLNACMVTSLVFSGFTWRGKPHSFFFRETRHPMLRKSENTMPHYVVLIEVVTCAHNKSVTLFGSPIGLSGAASRTAQWNPYRSCVENGLTFHVGQNIT